MNYLIIDEIFEIKDRGFVLTGQLPDNPISISVGDFVDIEGPEGFTFCTKIIGIEHLCLRVLDRKDNHPFGLLVGTEAKNFITKGGIIKPIK